MRIRNPRPPEEPDDDSADDLDDDVDHDFDDDFADDFSDGTPDRDDFAGLTEVSFSVPTGVVVTKFAVAAALVVLTVVFGVRDQVPIGLAAALAVALYAVRDVIARVRLRAGPDGLVAVSGYAGRQHLDWSDVQRITVDSRLRLGARTETLELDAGDHLFLYGRYDLGVAPAEALAALEAVRPD